MDTDELSKEAYIAIMIEAEKFNHDLTLQFGLLSYECKNESEYLEKAIILINYLQEAKPEDLDDIFFGEAPEKIRLNQALKKIKNNIAEVELIPIEKRHYDF